MLITLLPLEVHGRVPSSSYHGTTRYCANPTRATKARDNCDSCQSRLSLAFVGKMLRDLSMTYSGDRAFRQSADGTRDAFFRDTSYRCRSCLRLRKMHFDAPLHALPDADVITDTQKQIKKKCILISKHFQL